MKVLDLYCGAGGAAMGLHQAWPDAEITGVDVAPQPHYPFNFVQADALTFPLDEFDFIWASPPCQAYSSLRSFPGRSIPKHPPLISPTRARLTEWGGPWVMENVERAPLQNGIRLCGLMFGLHVYRHRLFESSQLLLGPPHLRHRETIADGITSTRYINEIGRMVTVAGHLFGLAAGSHAMGIDWMDRDELAQAIPPAYARYIAEQYQSETVTK
jgi:DNA (cytosine-5)-methyltransferase 1